MIQNAFLSVSKAAVVALLLLAAYPTVAQRNMKPKLPGSEYQNFLNTQWWLGIKVGMNYSQPIPGQRYSSIDPINYDLELLEKEYDQFNRPGVMLGLDISIYHKGFSIGTQPVFKSMGYSYNSSIQWTGDTEAQTFETAYESEQNMSYIELPLSVKYEFIQSGKVRPYLMAGMQYSFLLDANKKTDITHTDNQSGAPVTYSGGSVSINVKDGFQNYYGALGGIGAAFDYFNIRTVLEISYNYGLSSITNTNTRFSENELVSLGETNDEIKINNINASLSIVFPLRYIDKTFSPY